MKKTVLYYSDELNDDFAGTNIERKELPENFKYMTKCPMFNIAGFVLYRLIATPLCFLFVKVVYHQRFKNRKVLREARGEGYFLYGNHTSMLLDAYVPTLLTFPKKAYIVANPEVTSIPGIRSLVMMLGVLPLPNGFDLSKKFLDALDKRTEEKQVVTIYPEAHIWPYYTDVRDFRPNSMKYPYMDDKPVYCFTNIYKEQRLFKRPRVETYIDGPFYIDHNHSKKENTEMLKEKVYEAMKERVAENPKFEYKYEYVKVDKGA